MKHSDFEHNREKRIHKVVKGTNKVDKHRKSIYNMLSEEDFDNDDELDQYEISNTDNTAIIHR